MLKFAMKFIHWLEDRRIHASGTDLMYSSSYIRTVEDTEPEPVSGVPDVDGCVVCENGTLRVTDPEGMGVYPSLVVPPELQGCVVVDGQKVDRHVIVVTSTNTITFDVTSVPPRTKVEISVSNDAMAVSMKVILKHGERKTVRPFTSTTKAMLEMDVVNEPARAPSYEELLEALQANGFVGEVDEQALRALSRAVTTTERIVLKGREPVYGTPPSLKRVPLRKGHDPMGRMHPVDSVKVGAVVAYVEAGTPSVPGVNVCGETIYGPEMHASLPKFGNGVIQVNNSVVAVRAGRVHFTNTLVDVVPRLTLHKDIHPKDGYIAFDGDIVIHGSIQDGSRVKASGILSVFGGVFGSTIVGEQGVRIQGSCVGSNLWAGWAQQLYKDVLPFVQSLIATLKALEEDMGLILERNDTKKLPAEKRKLLAGLLIDQYHTELLPALSKLVDEYDSTNLHEVAAQLGPIVQTVQQKWLGLQYKHLALEDVRELMNLFFKYKTYMETTISNDTAHVTVESVTSSTIHCTGDVTITGFGAHSSAIESGGTIHVSGSVRGGFLIAEESVQVRELGSDSGVESSVKVRNPEGNIFVGLRHSNTVLVVDAKRNRNLLTERNVKFSGGMGDGCESAVGR